MMPFICVVLALAFGTSSSQFRATAINSADAFMAVFPKSGVEVDLRDVWKRFGVEEEGFAQFSSDGVGQMVSKSVLNPELHAVQLWVYKGPSRIVLFRRANNMWAFFAVIDIELEALEQAKLALREAGSRRWVTVTSYDAEGTGIGARTVTWYELLRTGLKQVLVHPGDGALAAGDLLMPFGVIREVKTALRNIAIENGRTIIRVEFRVRFEFIYGSKGDVAELFEQTDVATFRESVDGTFHLVPSSTLTPMKLSALYDIAHGRLTAQDFLEFEYDRLQDIVVRGNPAKKGWLNEFVRQCKRLQLCSDTKGLPDHE